MKRIGFIGAGKVGTSLGAYFCHNLNSNDYFVEGYYSKNNNSAIDAAAYTKTKPYDNLEGFISKCHIIIITCPDDQIISVYNKIKNLNIQNKIVCHTSGTLSSSIFLQEESLKKPTYFASLHPMYAFNLKNIKDEDLKHATFTLEGNDYAVKELSVLLDEVNLNHVTLNKEINDKTKYHLASIFSSNLILPMVDISINLLIECGFTEYDAKKALRSLFLKNAENVFNTSVLNSLSGPIERNDVKTIKKHINALELMEEDIKDVYLNLSKRLLKLTKTRDSINFSNRNLNELKEILDGDEKDNFNL